MERYMADNGKRIESRATVEFHIDFFFFLLPIWAAFFKETRCEIDISIDAFFPILFSPFASLPLSDLIDF